VFGSKGKQRGRKEDMEDFFFNFRDDGAKIPPFPFCLPISVGGKVICNFLNVLLMKLSVRFIPSFPLILTNAQHAAIVFSLPFPTKEIPRPFNQTKQGGSSPSSPSSPLNQTSRYHM